MRVFIYIPFLMLLSCVKQADTPIVEDDIYPIAEVPVPTSKYSFIVIVTDEPNENGREKQQYTTTIDTINKPIDEDFQYKQLDIAEANLRDAELDSIQSYYKTDVKIIKRNFYVFDTYKEASLSRQEFLQNN